MNTRLLSLMIFAAAAVFPVAATAAVASAAVSVTIMDSVGISEFRGTAPVAHARVGDSRAVLQVPTYALAGPDGQVASFQSASSVTLQQAGGGERLMAFMSPVQSSSFGGRAQLFRASANVALSRAATAGLYTGALRVAVDYN